MPTFADQIAAPSVAARIVAYARDQIGDPYVWGAEGPNGFDCSGLVYAAYKAAGLDVPRTTAASLGKQGQAVPESQALPGDLVYFDHPGATDHVGIYVGRGQMIEAPRRGIPVRVAAVAGRNPTSFRHLPGVDGGATVAALGANAGARSSDFAGATGSGTATAEDGGGLFGIFDGWQNSLLNIALKITAGAAVVGLVVVGAKTAMQTKGEAE